MLRAAAMLCALAGTACSDNPYVIGAFTDASTGAGTNSNECAGARASALVCSGFETRALEPEWSVNPSENRASIERSSARVHSGTGALHATSSAAMSAATVKKDFRPVRSGDLYLRLFVYVPGGLPTRTINFLYLGDVDRPDPFVGIDFNLEDGALSVYSPQANPTRQTGMRTIPRDRWFCLRADVSVRDRDGRVQLFVDDALALDATNIDSLPDAGLREFRAGIDWSSDQDEFFEIYFDDVVIDTREVGCD